MNNNKKKFNLYDFMMRGNGKGVTKEEIAHPRDFKFFFTLLRRNITNILYVNLYTLFGNFPIVFALIGLGYTLEHNPIPSTPAFAQLYGAIKQSGFSNAAYAALYGVHGVRSSTNVPTQTTYILLALSLLVVFTFGIINVGTTYLLRNIVKGEPVFMWNDFWHAIKKNFKQGLLLGIIDIVVYLLTAWNIFIMFFNSSDFLYGLIFYGNILLMLIYTVMRYYTYIMAVTFDLSIFKILKNALIFSVLGIKRNILALLGTALLIVIEVALVVMFIPLGLIFIFFLFFGLSQFMGIYAAFPKIKQIMIDPYYKEEEKEEVEQICKDNG